MRGKVYLDTDYYGWYEQCLQCGYTKNMAKVAKVAVEMGDKYAAQPVELTA
jgi:hypothetical protein